MYKICLLYKFCYITLKHFKSLSFILRYYNIIIYLIKLMSTSLIKLELDDNIM